MLQACGNSQFTCDDGRAKAAAGRLGEGAVHSAEDCAARADLPVSACGAPAATPPAQQGRLAKWLRLYNHQRPHEALGLRPPAECYHRSRRRFRGVRPPAIAAAGLCAECVPAGKSPGLGEAGLLAKPLFGSGSVYSHGGAIAGAFTSTAGSSVNSIPGIRARCARPSIADAKLRKCQRCPDPMPQDARRR